MTLLYCRVGLLVVTEAPAVHLTAKDIPFLS